MMSKLATLTAAAALVAAFGFAGSAMAQDPEADAVAPGGDNIENVSCGGDCAGAATDTLEAVDTNAASLGTDGFVLLDFTDNFCLIAVGNDVTVTEIVITDDDTDDFTVKVATNGGTLSSGVIGGGGAVSLDLSPTGVSTFNQIQITDNTNGGTAPTTIGADIDAVECLSSFDFDDIDKVFADHSDDGGERDEVDQTTGDNDGLQFKAFEITITNNTGIDDAFAGLTFIDVVPAEWDLDPLEEFDVNGCDNAPEVCDGVDVTAADDDVADCTATGAEHTNQGKGPAKLQPDIITITAGGLANGDSCTITVWVTTDDDQPGKGRGKKNANGEGNPDFTPTSCPVTLNDGVKVFDASLNLLLQDDSSLIFDNGATQADGTGVDGTCNPA